MRAGRNVGGVRKSGSSSDYARGQAELARTRLGMEMEERRKNLEDGEVTRAERGSKSTTTTGLETIESPVEERMEFVAQSERSMEESEQHPGEPNDSGDQVRRVSV